MVVYPTNVAGQQGPRRERFLDNKSIDGNIAMMLRGTLEVLQRHLKRRGIVHGLIRIDEMEYPIEVLREAIVNALAHRDYSSAALGTQVQLELFPDRLVIRNLGGLFGPVSEATLGIEMTSSSRNAALLKVLEDAEAEAGRTVYENRGSGIATMRALLGAVGMNPPVFRDEIASFELQISNEVSHRPGNRRLAEFARSRESFSIADDGACVPPSPRRLPHQHLIPKDDRSFRRSPGRSGTP